MVSNACHLSDPSLMLEGTESIKKNFVPKHNQDFYSQNDRVKALCERLLNISIKGIFWKEYAFAYYMGRQLKQLTKFPPSVPSKTRASHVTPKMLSTTAGHLSLLGSLFNFSVSELVKMMDGLWWLVTQSWIITWLLWETRAKFTWLVITF